MNSKKTATGKTTRACSSKKSGSTAASAKKTTARANTSKKTTATTK